MILTVTPTPVLERFGVIDGPLTGGEVLRLRGVDTCPGGCGVTVARLIYLAGHPVHAIFPAPEISQYLRMIGLLGIPHDHVPVAGPVQTRFLVADDSGRTTQFLDPAMPLDTAQLAQLRDLTVSRAEDAAWVVLGGPLPDVAPTAWYVEVIRALALYHPTVGTAVATSGAPLRAVIRQLSAITPSLLALTTTDIADMVPDCGIRGVERSLEDGGDLSLVRDAVTPLLEAGVSEVLVSGAPGTAMCLTQGSTWIARSGAGSETDAGRFRELLLAGYLMNHGSDDRMGRLSTALAYASAETTAGSGELPTPDLIHPEQVTCTELGS
ncbi:1-phosphofructokinase family hexose kinase [Corynebacterium sp. P7003]|uniref:1-phosphofructokinase family hexose kinase n=1 Tax=Corynebacterium pygosceleis TaxID=2800406 RepID=A0ABT3WNZ7_9CORY|nr:PfkB family carbohydrate kinase [Corynebacterium pygosceleis]MCX7443906.1 1-phosphofructokinase family hexose kinase [Corynebacterium pygosceleis]